MPVSEHIGIGEQLRARRLQSGLTQEAVVFALRERGRATSVSTYQRWEQSGSLRMEDAAVLADILGFSLDELLGADGPRERDADELRQALATLQDQHRELTERFGILQAQMIEVRQHLGLPWREETDAATTAGEREPIRRSGHG
jgi:transcriptional regulator with XRE-family HTH domain